MKESTSNNGEALKNLHPEYERGGKTFASIELQCIIYGWLHANLQTSAHKYLARALEAACKASNKYRITYKSYGWLLARTMHTITSKSYGWLHASYASYSVLVKGNVGFDP